MSTLKPKPVTVEAELELIDKQTIAYIKASEILDRNKYGIYNSDGYLFVVNIITNIVVLAFYDNELIVNITVNNEDLLIKEVKAALEPFIKDIAITYDEFFIDTDINAIYIGKAARDYQNQLASEGRILH